MLAKEWKRTCKELPLAREAFDAITKGAGSAMVKKWEAEASAAHEKRFTDITAMDIFDVQSVKDRSLSPGNCYVCILTPV